MPRDAFASAGPVAVGTLLGFVVIGRYAKHVVARDADTMEDRLRGRLLRGFCLLLFRHALILPCASSHVARQELLHAADDFSDPHRPVEHRRSAFKMRAGFAGHLRA